MFQIQIKGRIESYTINCRELTIMQGKIKAVTSKGFGFIETDKHIDYFFHHSQFAGDWKKLVLLMSKSEDIKVDCQFESDPTAIDGPRAINVKLV